MSAGLIIGITLGTITLCTLLAMLAIYIRRQREQRRIANFFLLPPPAQTKIQNKFIPSMPYIQSPSTGPNSPLESPIVRTATVYKLRNVGGSGSGPGFTVVLLDENAITRPRSAVVRASPPLYPGHVPYIPPGSVG